MKRKRKKKKKKLLGFRTGVGDPSPLFFFLLVLDSLDGVADGPG
jgi:hypothetical protein